MSTSSLRERFARLGPFQAVDPVLDGSPAVLSLRPASDLAEVETVSAALALSRRGIGMLKAKRAIEAMIDDGRCAVFVPKLESAELFAAEMAGHGITVRRMDRSPVDVRAIRERLGFEQDQFALQYGLDLDNLRNWEDGRGTPDLAVESYLRAIARFPGEISLAQEESVG
jgi:DNA-binding transcriptional regulator YiaG